MLTILLEDLNIRLLMAILSRLYEITTAAAIPLRSGRRRPIIPSVDAALG